MCALEERYIDFCLNLSRELWEKMIIKVQELDLHRGEFVREAILHYLMKLSGECENCDDSVISCRCSCVVDHPEVNLSQRKKKFMKKD